MNKAIPRGKKGIAIKGKNLGLPHFCHFIKKYLLFYKYTLFQPDIYLHWRNPFSVKELQILYERQWSIHTRSHKALVIQPEADTHYY